MRANDHTHTFRRNHAAGYAEWECTRRMKSAFP